MFAHQLEVLANWHRIGRPCPANPPFPRIQHPRDGEIALTLQLLAPSGCRFVGRPQSTILHQLREPADSRMPVCLHRPHEQPEPQSTVRDFAVADHDRADRDAKIGKILERVVSLDGHSGRAWASVGSCSESQCRSLLSSNRRVRPNLKCGRPPCKHILHIVERDIPRIPTTSGRVKSLSTYPSIFVFPWAPQPMYAIR